MPFTGVFSLGDSFSLTGTRCHASPRTRRPAPCLGGPCSVKTLAVGGDGGWGRMG